MALKSMQYQTQGTCCALINIVIEDNTDTVYDVEFLGGCNGNLEGIKHLIKGMKIEDVIGKLNGIKCGAKETSCPDQLSKCLLKYKQQIQQDLKPIL